MALKSTGMKKCLQAFSIIRMGYFKRTAGFQLRQEYSSQHSASYDDEFAELGSPLVSGLRRPVKLMTEKNDWIKKKGSRWNSSGLCSTMEAIAGTEYVQLDSKGAFSDETNAINTRTAFVTVANIPPSLEISKLMEALSLFGKIFNSSIRTLRNGSICCDVKFEREEATQKALSTGSITVNDVHLLIDRGHGTVTVRIVNVCSKTSDSMVHRICRSCGFLIKMERIDANTLDVFFGVKNKSDAKNILKGLNYTIIDDSPWSARLQSGDAAASASTSNDKDYNDVSCNSGVKIGEQIMELKQLYNLKKVLTEDLENLHEVIMHIKSRNADLKEKI